ncbi:MAG: CBS domain-containing protein [Hyphomicrobiales bacterium]|nr:CBS domain-containing protein [Hyphomicrobiales bacterium]
MIPNVITVGVDASIGEVAAILLNNHISAAPVVDENGELVGIVSEGDLIRRPEIGTSERHSWWLELISNEWASATECIKSHSRKVADVMTRDVITAKPDTPLGDIAALLERNRIKRVPIVEEGKLAGLVSRANILQALASATKKLSSLATANDSELRKKVQSRLAAEPWHPSMLTVTVQDGTVDLWGLVHSVEQKKAAQLAAESTPGVGAVVNNIIVQRVGYAGIMTLPPTKRDS